MFVISDVSCRIATNVKDFRKEVILMTNIFKLRMNKMHTILMKTKLPSDLFHIYLN